MNRRNAALRDASVDDQEILGHSELLSLIDDFESLVAAGFLQGTRQEALQFFSGWLAFGDPEGQQ